MMQREGESLGWEKDSGGKKRSSKSKGISIQKSRVGRQILDPPRAAGTLATPLNIDIYL